MSKPTNIDRSKPEVIDLRERYTQEAALAMSAKFDEALWMKGGDSTPIKKPSLYKRLGERFTRYLMDKFGVYNDF